MVLCLIPITYEVSKNSPNILDIFNENNFSSKFSDKNTPSVEDVYEHNLRSNNLIVLATQEIPLEGGGEGRGKETVTNSSEESEGVVEDTMLPEQLFDITFNLESFIIQSISEFSGIVTFESFGTVPTAVNLTLIILNENGNEIYRDDSEIIVTTEEVLRLKYKGSENISDNIDDGKYTVILHTLYNVDVFDEFRQEFELRKDKSLLDKSFGVIKNFLVDYFLWWAIFVILLLVLFIIYSPIKTKKTKVTKKNNVKKK